MPGSPPIADTIFEKINECSIFVPDLTFVGATESGRLLPNPNVLVEHGWALAKCGHAKIVAVANTAFGELTPESVPFDLRHHLWPIRFHLTPNTKEKERESVKEQLVAELVQAIENVLAKTNVQDAAAAYIPMQPKTRVSSFLDDGELLCRIAPRFGRGQPTEIVWHDGPQLFLRVIPQVPITGMSPRDLAELVRESNLPLLGSSYGQTTTGNEYGAITFDLIKEGDNERADLITQVSDHGEIWAIDAHSLREYDDVQFIELLFASKLAAFFEFLTDKLNVLSNVSIVAGMTGVAGRSMLLPPPPKNTNYPGFRQTIGSAVRDEIVFEIDNASPVPSEIIDLEVREDLGFSVEGNNVRHAYKTLIPFFEHVYGIFDFNRMDFLPT